MIAEIPPKIQKALQQSGLDGLILTAPENITYATGVVLPFARHYPDRPAAAVLDRQGQSALICPLEWAEVAAGQGFAGRILPWGDNDGPQPAISVRLLVQLLAELRLDRATLGLDLDSAPAALVEALAGLLPGLQMISADSLLRSLRLIKTPPEVALIEQAAVIADKGIIGAMNHLEGTVGSLDYTLAEVAERTRVHAIEHLASGIGHLCAVQGAGSRLEYAPATAEIVRPGELLRVDCSIHVQGYWACAGRMMVTGQPGPAQAAAYRDNRLLAAAAVQALKPGIPAAAVFKAVAAEAAARGLSFRPEAGVGHGVGTAEIEPPFLTADDTAELQAGMVLAVDVWSEGPAGELIHSIDTCEIIPGGSRLLSWYKTTGHLYALTGFRASH